MTYSADSPLVSIIMNCYDGDKYLQDAIESVCAQTYHNWEIVFWDNLSIDRSADIFKSYDDARFHYHRSDEHTSLGIARNLALKKCRGELVAFLDVDDWWVPEKLDLQVLLFQDQSVGMSCGNFFFSNERNGLSKTPQCAYTQIPSGSVTDDLFQDFFVHFSNLMVRKKALDQLSHLFDSRFNIIEDFDLVIRLSIDWQMASVQVPISYYRWHKNNTGHNSSYLIGQELKLWYDMSKDNSSYLAHRNFGKFEQKVRYYDLLRMLYTGKKMEALKRLRYVPLQTKAKALIGVLLPTKLLRKWMDR